MTLGNIGVPVGTELVMPLAGAAAAMGHLSSWWLAGLVGTLGEVVGGGILYAVGYAGGRPIVVRYGKYVKLSEQKLDAFHGFYEKHGNIVVLACRFLPLVRGISALPAGVSRMPKRYFFAYTALGSAGFCFGLAYLGNLFGHRIGELTHILHKFSFALIVALVIAAVAFVAYRVIVSRRSAKAT
jgi:membrane protein DedA with SNARE-associated domain